jgi:DNA-binding winged helix-turn-helix (wHTH) protein
LPEIVMPDRRTISFGAFHLDSKARQLRHRGVARPLRAKSFAVLWYLASHPGRLIPQDELMRAVWPETSVGTAVLRVSIREIRAALGGAANLLVTVPRQGHRFAFDLDSDARSRPFVGRDAEISALHRAFVRACSGARQIVFVTGESGVGKSRLVERFLDDLRTAANARVLFGQCVELNDGLEAYAPILDLLHRVCRAPESKDLERTAARYAPTWLRQLSGRDEEQHDHRAASLHAAPTRGQLQRELSTLLEAWAHEQPLVIKLQDLHWADASTLDALAHVAQRDIRAPLLIVCTYRPNVGLHAERLDQVRRQMFARHRGREIQLGTLDAAGVDQFLVRRLAPTPLGSGVAATMYARTCGQPLFLTALTEHLLVQRQLVVHDGAWQLVGTLDGVIPTAIREMIATTFQTVGPERRLLLDAASVAGTTFSAAAVSAVLNLSIAEIEDACDQLVGEGRLAHGGIEEWPDGTTSARYSFLHQMHAEVLYAALTPAMRSRFHQMLGERVSDAHAGHLNEVAALLAHHFSLAGDDERAWYAHRQAARAARDGLAARESIGHLESALTMIRALPPSEKRTRVELRCLLELGEAAIAVHGYAVPRVAGIYQRACEKSVAADDVASHVVAESGLFVHHMARGELGIAQERAEEILRIAQHLPMLAGTGHWCLGAVLLSRGELLPADDAFQRAATSWEDLPDVALDPHATLHGLHAIVRLVRGQLQDTRQDIDLMLARVAELPFDPLLVAQCHAIAAHFHAIRGAADETRVLSAPAMALSATHPLPLYLSPRIAHGWATQDAAAIRAEMALLVESEARIGAALYGALLADTLLRDGDGPAAADAIERACAAASVSGEDCFSAELHRLRGRCRLLEAKDAARSARRSLLGEAHESFQQAIALAARQGAGLWQLRATTDACETSPRPAQAHADLRDLLAEIDDGSDAPDLVRARARLAGR